MSDVTQILSKVEQGDPSAADLLLPLVYEELRRLASSRMSQENPDHSLSATALVHEAYIRLVDHEHAQRWRSRGHFFGAAAEAMRRILVESARRKRSLKRGGDQNRVGPEAVEARAGKQQPVEDILAIDEALEELAAEDPVKADLVKLRYFAGLSTEEAAEVLGISAPPPVGTGHIPEPGSTANSKTWEIGELGWISLRRADDGFRTTLW